MKEGHSYDNSDKDTEFYSDLLKNCHFISVLKFHIVGREDSNFLFKYSLFSDYSKGYTLNTVGFDFEYSEIQVPVNNFITLGRMLSL